MTEAVSPAPPDHVATVLREAAAAPLEPLARSLQPLPPPGSPILVTVVKDELDRLQDFLRHYREAGIRRFCCIDNGSSDGTTAWLAAQPDVDLWSCRAPFDPRRKQGWITRAMEGYGLPRWFLCADADEHVVYEGDAIHGLEALAAEMEGRGIRRVRGVMIDMVPAGPLQRSAYRRGGRLVEAYPFYERDGYEESRHDSVMSVRGGPRKRLLGHLDPKFNPELTKYPLFLLLPGDVMASPHYLWPYEANFASPRHLGILHFKFLPNFAEKVRAAVAHGGYWDGSLEYRCYARALAENPEIAAHGEASARYAGAAGLVLDGLIVPVGWGRGATAGERMLAAARRHRAALLGGARPLRTQSDLVAPTSPRAEPAAAASLERGLLVPLAPARAPSLPPVLAPTPATRASGDLAVTINEVRIKAPNYRHLDLSVANLVLPDGIAVRARFKLGLSGVAPRLEFRQGPDWPMFSRAWPGTEEDKWGGVFRVGPGGPRARIMARIPDSQDRDSLAAVIDRMPEIVALALPQTKLSHEEVVLFSRAARELPAALA